MMNVLAGPTDRVDDPLSIIEVVDPSAEFTSVLTLWRGNRQWLGFLPTQAFRERIAKGTLLAAVRGTRLVGYVLYDLPRDYVKVIHLCVAETERGGGIARALIDEVSSRHRERRGIGLSCRREFPASSLWPKLGFVPHRERAGRSDAGLPLTVWFRDHGHPDLFTFVPGVDPGDRIAVAVDQNVVIDLVMRRDEARQTIHLEDDWLTEYIVLCITDEVDQEINNCDDAATRELMRAGLHRFRRLSTPSGVEGGWEELVPAIQAAAPKAGAPDHRHIARAKAGGTPYFVTRDRPLNEAKDRILAATGVQVMRPEELIRHVDKLRATDRYEPVALHATPVSIRSAVGSEPEFVRRFLNYAQGEKKVRLEAGVRRALAEPTAYEVLVIEDAAGDLVGGVVRRWMGDTLYVDLMRVAGADRTSYAVARQLAFLQRQEVANSRQSGEVVLRDENPSAAVRDALEIEGYEHADGVWTSSIRRGVCPVADFEEASAIGDSGASRFAAAVERRLWPMKVTGAGLPTFVVSIRPVWAEQLFDSTLASRTLFGRAPGLGLSREHIYYRSPRNSNGIAPPARILWYVSGRSHGEREGSIRAVSQLAEVVVGRSRTIHQRFARLGVFDLDQVSAASDDSGRVMALRFTDTELFTRPIMLSEARSIAQTEGANFVPPMSPRRIDEGLFERLYRQASAYA